MMRTRTINPAGTERSLAATRLLLCVSLVVGCLPVLQALDPPPRLDEAELSHDEYSGRPVTDMMMAELMIRKRHFNAPRAGEIAPAFTLADQRTGELVSLKSLHAKKPVVLFFGSYGCDVMKGGVGELFKVRERFSDQLDFCMIYIREAHSLDWVNTTKGEFADPKSDSERMQMAQRCRADIRIPFRILVDSVDDKTATRWGAWPLRLFVIGTDGKVIYAGRSGPWGFHPSESFLGGKGEIRGADVYYNKESLEAFLMRVFPESGKAE